jgi:hypothetical protein
MSLSSLARVAMPRRPAAAPGDPERVRAPGPAASPDGFDALAKYIPTETVTLFVAAMAVREPLAKLKVGTWDLYFAGAALTPILLLLIVYGRHRQSGAIGHFRPHPWPIAAALIAFLVWALSVPGLLADSSGQLLAAFGAVFVSTLLSLLEPVFGPRPALGD